MNITGTLPEVKHPGLGLERGISSGVIIFFPTLHAKLFGYAYALREKNFIPSINKIR